ncbi:hypothetical protein GCM10023200_16870 [Actinomycetospora chlora]|uniref:DUF3618 domain-containing protein n=1 Tax=Actinomycetospora chlora TaxID=663608 RepID=A0ABP9ANK9_9PSEU
MTGDDQQDQPEVIGRELAAIAAEELAAEVAATSPPPWGPRPDLAATAHRPTPRTLALGLGSAVVVAGVVVWGVRRRR